MVIVNQDITKIIHFMWKHPSTIPPVWTKIALLSVEQMRYCDDNHAYTLFHLWLMAQPFLSLYPLAILAMDAAKWLSIDHVSPCPGSQRQCHRCKGHSSMCNQANDSITKPSSQFIPRRLWIRNKDTNMDESGRRIRRGRRKRRSEAYETKTVDWNTESSKGR